MKERDLYAKLRKEVKNTMFKRIENSLEPGTPDIYFSNQNISGWMEAKKLVLGSKFIGEVKIPFRPAQFEWLKQHYEYGGVSVLGIISDWGIFFAINENIKKVYQRKEFRDGTLVCPKNLNKFFNEELRR